MYAVCIVHAFILLIICKSIQYPHKNIEHVFSWEIQKETPSAQYWMHVRHFSFDFWIFNLWMDWKLEYRDYRPIRHNALRKDTINIWMDLGLRQNSRYNRTKNVHSSSFTTVNGKCVAINIGKCILWWWWRWMYLCTKLWSIWIGSGWWFRLPPTDGISIIRISIR